MEDKIIEIIADRTEKNAEYLREHRKEQKLWDSLQRVEMVLALEEEFDLIFEPAEIEAMVDVDTVVHTIIRRVA